MYSSIICKKSCIWLIGTCKIIFVLAYCKGAHAQTKMNLEKIGEIWEYFGGIHANPRTGSIDVVQSEIKEVHVLLQKLARTDMKAHSA